MTEKLELVLKMAYTRLRLRKFARYPFHFFGAGPQSFNISCLGLPKVPTACLFSSYARAPRDIRSYIDSLLQAEYQTCVPSTIKNFSLGKVLVRDSTEQDETGSQPKPDDRINKNHMTKKY